MFSVGQAVRWLTACLLGLLCLLGGPTVVSAEAAPQALRGAFIETATGSATSLEQPLTRSADMVQPPTNSATENTDIAADKVDNFAKAYLQILKLLSDRESELPAAETNAEAMKIQQSIEADAIKIITDSGLSMPEYMQILTLASQDATFRSKVLGRMDESLESPS